MVDCTIRQAQASDNEQIHQILIESIQTLYASDYTTEQIDYLVSMISKQSYQVENGRLGTFFVAEAGGKIIGFSSFMLTRINGMYVHPDYIRQGVGTQLLEAIETEAMARSLKALMVMSSLTAQSFYLARGYQIVGESSLTLIDEVSWKIMRLPCTDMEKWLIPANVWEKFLWYGYAALERTARWVLTGEFLE